MLIERIINKYKTISIVGMAKNAGKTVTLNALLDEAYESQVTIGLTSIGRDGERQDLVTQTEKPMIYVYEGTLVATSESLFQMSDAKLEVMEITDFHTPMGKIVIGKVIFPGYIQIAGPSRNSEIMSTAEKMRDFGANLVVVDGAIDRKTTASPSITDATILSTGAVLSRDMQTAITKTVYQVALFNLEKTEDVSIRAIADQAIRNNEITVIGETVKALDIKTALNAGHTIGAALKDDSTAILLPGSLVTKTVMDMIKTNHHYKHVTVVVRDATRIFIDYKDWIYFEKLGVRIKVLDSINLLAVTINPTAPEGYYFDRESYKNQLAFYLKDLPVIDVMS
ncbi:MAG: hypothetical protein JXR88_10380 [Clostridia bacterium]|nr:hypothetical protein [Clostridia bacterium]